MITGIHRKWRARDLVGLTMFATILALGMALAAFQGKPRVVHPFKVEDRGALGTLKELIDRSDLIVEGTIGDGHATDYGDWPYIFTTYDFVVSAIFKSSNKLSEPVRPSGTIQVRRWGGERERSDHVDAYIADNYPAFKRGDRVLLFLRTRTWAPPAPYVGTYFTETTYGPDSVFYVGNGPVRPWGNSRLSKNLALPSANDLRSELSRLAGGR